jgi:hypothetical protein
MRHFLKQIPSVAILCASLCVTGITGVAAQDATPMPGQGCVGTWLLRVTGLGQPASTSFPVTAIFGADGSFIVTSPVVRPAQGAPDQANFLNPGLGVWQATDTGTCAVTHVFYVTDAKGNQLNTLEIRLLMVVGPDGNTMDGTDYATVMAPDGTVLVSGPGNTIGGARLVLKLAPPASSPSPKP